MVCYGISGVVNSKPENQEMIVAVNAIYAIA